MINEFGCFNLSVDLNLFQKQCLVVLIFGLGNTTEKKNVLYCTPFSHCYTNLLLHGDSIAGYYDGNHLTSSGGVI